MLRLTRVRIRLIGRYVEVSLAVLLVGLIVTFGTSGMLHMRKDLGKLYPGFVWGLSYHGGVFEPQEIDGGFINLATPSSGSIHDDRNWNDVFVSVDGRPVTMAGEAFSALNPGDSVTLEFKQGNKPDGASILVERPVEVFTWSRMAESVGVYYLGGLVFAACGLVLVCIRPLRGSYLPSAAGWTLLMAAAFVEVGLRTTFASTMKSPSWLADITWHVSYGLTGTIALLLACALVLSSARRARLRRVLPFMFFVSAACAICGLAYNFVSFGLGLWWLPSFLYATLGGLAVLGAASFSFIRFVARGAPQGDYRGLVSLPFVGGFALVLVIAVIPAILGESSLLPSNIIIALVTMLPIGLLYSVLAMRALEDRDEKAAIAVQEADRARDAALAVEVSMLRYRAEVAGFKGFLHDEILPSINAVVWTSAAEGTNQIDGEALGSRLRGITSTIRRGLTTLTADQPMAEDFPSPVDVEKLIVDTMNTRSSTIDVNPNLYTCAEEIRKLLYVHLHTMLVNAAEHGNATSVEVSLRRDGADAVMCVIDNGSGFDRSVLDGPKPASSAGLREAIAVARALGGWVQVESDKTDGTRIEERLPADGRNSSGAR